MKEIIGFLIFCGLTQKIAAASREDINIIRRFAISPSSEFPRRYVSKKWPTYSYKPYYRPRPTYTIPIPIDEPYVPTPVKKPARPNKTKPSNSYQHNSRPVDYVPRPPKPTSDYSNLENSPDYYPQTQPSLYAAQSSLDYPNLASKPADLYNPSPEIYNRPKPKPSRPTKPSEYSPQNPPEYSNRPDMLEDLFSPSHQKPKPSQPSKPSAYSPQNPSDYPNRPNKPEDLYNLPYQKPKPLQPSRPSEYSPQNPLDYPNRPDALYNPSYQPYKPKPKPKPPTNSKPTHPPTKPNSYTHYDSYEPTPAYPSYPVFPEAGYERPGSTAPYPMQFLQEPSNTYEDEYPSQFYDTNPEKPEQTAQLSQYLQNDNNWRLDEDSYYDRVVFYPYELNYGVQRPNGYDDIYDYPEVIEELKEAIFKKEPQQARSIRRHANDVFQSPNTHPRGLLVPYKTWEYNPSALNHLKIWKSKFYHPYKWWSHKKPELIYHLHNKLRKPMMPNSHPYSYINAGSPYLWGHLPLISTRPASVHRIRNFAMDQSDSSSVDNYSDDVMENYLSPSEESGGFFQKK